MSNVLPHVGKINVYWDGDKTAYHQKKKKSIAAPLLARKLKNTLMLQNVCIRLRAE
jgi:hypothetical protein